MIDRNLQEAEDQLSALSSGLATVDERVAALKEQLGRHSRDAAALELSVASAAQTIAAATQLLDQLAHEYTAWERDVSYILRAIYICTTSYTILVPSICFQLTLYY